MLVLAPFPRSPIAWPEYVRRHLRSDLDAFVASMAAASHAPAPAAPTSGHYVVNLCDCNVDALWASAKGRFPYPKMLIVDLFLEASLQAAVHCYALDLFDAYAHARGDSSVVIREHGTERIFPDRFLKLLGNASDDVELRQLRPPRAHPFLDGGLRPGRGPRARPREPGAGGPRQRRPLRGVALRLPGRARRAAHPALAGAQLQRLTTPVLPEPFGRLGTGHGRGGPLRGHVTK
ncbi:MAG: hypothetical protein QM765_37445 [Myxococcales bacterium]